MTTTKTGQGNETSSVVVYCKCGGVIIAVDFNSYKNDRLCKKEVDEAFDEGYSIGKASDQFVRDNFGCKCNK